MISTLDRFLGSLLGSYIGCHYPHTEWPALHSDPLYTAWIKPPLLKCQLMDDGYLTPLPWLLYRYDNRAVRHHELALHLDQLSINGADMDAMTSLSTLYILGDSLEWLMQYSLSVRQTRSKLFEYLRQQQTNYPTALDHFSPLSLAASTTTRTHYKSDNATVRALDIALEASFNHRENLALALNSAMPCLTRTIVGCLLGAWGGLSVIPTAWMLLLPSEAKQAINSLARQLYQNWAGISSSQKTLEIFPLDL